MTTPVLLGYWRSALPAQPYPGITAKQEEAWARVRKEAQSWPDVNDFVNHDWLGRGRQLVAEYLERGTLVNQYRGLSACRFCEQHNGSAELTDGAFCWPEGLAHYVWEHDVLLPERFVTHVYTSSLPLPDAPRPTFPRLGQRDCAWSGSEFAHLLWTPDQPKDDYGLYVEANSEWWLHQAGSSEVAQ